VNSETADQLIKAIRLCLTSGGSQTPVEEKIGKKDLSIATRLAGDWKIDESNFLQLTVKCKHRELVLLLAGLVAELRTQARNIEAILLHRPREFEKLASEARLEDVWPLIEKFSSERKSAKRDYECKRAWRSRGKIGKIEQDFGGPCHPLLQFWPPDVVPPLPACLDGIFAGDSVNMITLQGLFGLDRHRFPAVSPTRKKDREKRYDYGAVTKIAAALLKEPRRQRRACWLADQDVRKRVLRNIVARAKQVRAERKICQGFQNLLKRFG